jgi:replicative DNA helicase
MKGKLPPSCPESEVQVLGALLQYPERLQQIVAITGVEDYYMQKHQIILQALLDMKELGTQVDRVLLKEHLRQAGKLAASGGAAYLTKLVKKVPTATNIEYHARLVREAADKRGIIRLCHEIEQKAYGAAKPIELAADLAESALRISRNGSNCENAFIRGRELFNLRNSANLYWKGQRVKTETVKLDFWVKVAIIGTGIGTVGGLLLSLYVHFWK